MMAPGYTPPIDSTTLKPLARKYIWWQTPELAVRQPERVIAQVMDIGDHADVEALAGRVGDNVLREVLRHAQPGQFRSRSWNYWHYRLRLAKTDQVPSLPARHFE
ncbi:MAG TPA: hypothetical protein VFJ15_00125 [Oleiagrimonas sp.]|nr:hypothetical protein [Oleiagrimonas sp.]